ncbi:MAG: F0F1 ATP synthase subunit B [Solirubrobacterales bacterium]
MSLLAEIPGLMLLAAESGGSSGGESGGGGGGSSPLVTPEIGLMLWTLLAFGVTMVVLSKLAFPRISKALEERATRVQRNVEESERQRTEAEELKSEYRERLREAREQADEIVTKAKKTGENAKQERIDEGKEKRDQIIEQARKDIESEKDRALDEIRKEVADLTVLATEKVARKSLTQEDQERLVSEALEEIDFSRLAGTSSGSEA